MGDMVKEDIIIGIIRTTIKNIKKIEMTIIEEKMTIEKILIENLKEIIVIQVKNLVKL